MRYQSKPVEIEAMQWAADGCWSSWSNDHRGAEDIVAWVNANGGEARHEPEQREWGTRTTLSHGTRIMVRTINGWAYAAPGHYIVMGSAMFTGHDYTEDRGPTERILRDFYPCDPETFESRWSTSSLEPATDKGEHL